MRDIFISHVEEDYPVVQELARGLEAAGFSTWYYERDSDAGPSYLLQTREAIMAAQAVVLVISTDALSSSQVTKEVVRAHEGNKPIVPLLRGVTDAEYKRRQPEWEEAIGAATSLAIPADGMQSLLPRILRGLDRLGVRPRVPAAKTDSTSPQPPSSAHTVAAIPAPPPAPPVPLPVPPVPVPFPIRPVVAVVIAIIGILTGASALVSAVNPAPGTVEAATYQVFPGVRTANLVANGCNATLNVVMVLGCVFAFRGRVAGFRIVRAAACGITAMVAIWIVWVLVAGVTAPAWSHLQPHERSGFVSGTMTLGIIALLLFGVVAFLFRKGR